MNQYFKSTIAIGALIISSCFAMATTSSREYINLNGSWDTALGTCLLPGSTDESHLGTHDVANPATSQLTRLWRYEGPVTYSRTITVPRSVKGMHLRLVMERTKPSTLWIDGDSIGSIGHIFAPHIYDLPKLKPGQHRIDIRIDNSPNAVPGEIHSSHAWSESTQTNWNGIVGKFRIEALPATYISTVRTYPDARNRSVKVVVEVESSVNRSAKLSLSAASEKVKPLTASLDIALKKGLNRFEHTIHLGKDALLWSEFHPSLYNLSASISGKKIAADSYSTQFGLRDFATDGTQFTINGKKTFLRGTHDACVFPLTGYAPADVESWRKVFQVAKEYGINHFRFHSFTPTEAAFTAADIEGIYLQTELPLWGTIDSTKTVLNEFLLREAHTILESFGNHPSFTMMGLGNELNGDVDTMRRWLADFRSRDPRHLYCFGSNNFLGWKGAQDGEDFFVTCRVGGGEGYSTHVRSSFAYVDAEAGGILNNTRPGTDADYSGTIARSPRPVVSHEAGQFQIYPDYSEIAKYTGVLYPYNLEIFRSRLAKNHLTDQIEAFHKASGALAMQCYKADMEYCFRTPGFGGFQLLDLKDYPGQGTALCGILDAHMGSKGLITPAEFRQFCAPVIPMARFDTYCVATDRPFSFRIALSNYTEADYAQTVSWSLSGGNFRTGGTISTVSVGQGDVAIVDSVAVSLSSIAAPTKLSLKLSTGTYSNSYSIWAYPSAVPAAPTAVHFTDTIDAKTIQILAKGGSVILAPKLKSIEKQSVGGLFTPDYWNYAMFKTISENAKREVSPGTLGLLMDARHSIFANFPTDGHSDWQWWSIARNSRPLILDGTPAGYRPVIQAIDNIERNHKLGILMEFRIGKGRLLLATTDFDAIARYPEGRWYRSALLSYAASRHFQPTQSITIDELKALLSAHVDQLDIKGVENPSDYDVK